MRITNVNALLLVLFQAVYCYENSTAGPSCTTLGLNQLLFAIVKSILPRFVILNVFTWQWFETWFTANQKFERLARHFFHEVLASISARLGPLIFVPDRSINYWYLLSVDINSFAACGAVAPERNIAVRAGVHAVPSFEVCRTMRRQQAMSANIRPAARNTRDRPLNQDTALVLEPPSALPHRATSNN